MVWEFGGKEEAIILSDLDLIKKIILEASKEVFGKEAVQGFAQKIEEAEEMIKDIAGSMLDDTDEEALEEEECGCKRKKFEYRVEQNPFISFSASAQKEIEIIKKFKKKLVKTALRKEFRTNGLGIPMPFKAHSKKQKKVF